MLTCVGSDEIARLRRVAFGPGSSAQERADAVAALRALSDRIAPERAGAGESESEVHAETDARPEETGHLVSTFGDESRGEITETVVDEDSEEPIWRRSIRVGWLVPIVAGSLLVGVVGALGATGRFENLAVWGSPTPSVTPPGVASGEVHPGDLQAADSWFGRQFKTGVDSYPDLQLLSNNGINPDDVRAALDAGNGLKVWVGKTTGKLCLLVASNSASNSTSNVAASCFERDNFAVGGAHLGMNGRMAHWDGNEVTADPPDPASANGGTVPQVPGSGRGDVDAANSWFASPATTRDAFPEDGMLGSMGVDQSEVRLVGPEDGSLTKLWVVKQGTTGFCLATVNNSKHTSQSQCATIAEFRTSGLSISDRGFAAYWNGESISSSPQ